MGAVVLSGGIRGCRSVGGAPERSRKIRGRLAKTNGGNIVLALGGEHGGGQRGVAQNGRSEMAAGRRVVSKRGPEGLLLGCQWGRALSCRDAADR